MLIYSEWVDLLAEAASFFAFALATAAATRAFLFSASRFFASASTFSECSGCCCFCLEVSLEDFCALLASFFALALATAAAILAFLSSVLLSLSGALTDSVTAVSIVS